MFAQKTGELVVIPMEVRFSLALCSAQKQARLIWFSHRKAL